MIRTAARLAKVYFQTHRTARRAIVGVAIALTALFSVLTAPMAQATIGRYVTTIVTWGPYNCIWMTGTGGTVQDCNGGYDSATNFVAVGSLTGVDPSIGENSWVNCRLIDARTGQLLWADGGTKGDGHDINCLRTLNTGSVNA